jgi:hypothetical protein
LGAAGNSDAAIPWTTRAGVAVLTGTEVPLVKKGDYRKPHVRAC